MQTNLAPVPENQRAAILDILRGFALLGICLANYFYCSLYILQTPSATAAYSTAGIDRWLTRLDLIFITGKFYSIFSLLFGIGFSIFFLRNTQKGKNAVRIFYRRLFFLMLMGLCHSLLLWDGDILFFYGIVGMLLPLFRNCSDRCILITAVILLLSPLLFDLLKVLTNGVWSSNTLLLPHLIEADKKLGITETNVSDWLIVHDGYYDLLNWCRNGTLLSWIMRLDSNRIPKVLALFLLGLYAGRHQIYTKLEAYIPLFKKQLLWGLGIGIPAGIALVVFEEDGKRLPHVAGLWDTAAYALNVVPLAMAYVSALVLLYLRPRARVIIAVMRHPGRMALSNYILQSAIGVGLFWGIGLGWGARFGPAVFLPIAAAVWFLQIWLSKIWLHYFEYGPLEWIWRMLTYGKHFPIKKKPIPKTE